MNQQSRVLVPLLCGLAISTLMLISVLGAKTERPSLALASITFVPPEPILSAEAYHVRLIGDQKPLLERRGSKRLAPASITKILTAVVAAERIGPSDAVVFSENAKSVEERRSPAKAGDTFVRDDLMRMMLVASANDAALSLAEAVGKKAGQTIFEEQIRTFVQLMNVKARIIGLQDTHFDNPTGLDAPDHFASAADISRLAEYVWRRHPAFWEMTRQREITVTAMDGAAYPLLNTDELLAEFPAIRGGKTGFTDNAKGALLLLYPVRPEHTAITVILKSEDRFGDGRKIIEWLETYAD